MGFNFHVGLPGPFSYSKRIGGSSRPAPSTAEQIEQIRIQGAIRDLYCPDHLKVNNGIDWALLVLGTLFIALFMGWWSLPIGLVIAAVIGGCHRARAQRRAAFGVERLASGAGCHRCQIDAEQDARRTARQATYRPLETSRPTTHGRHAR